MVLFFVYKLFLPIGEILKESIKTPQRTFKSNFQSSIKFYSKVLLYLFVLDDSKDLEGTYKTLHKNLSREKKFISAHTRNFSYRRNFIICSR